MSRRDQRAHLGLLVERVPDLHPLDALLERGHEVVDGGSLDEDARPRAAVLPGVVEDGIGRRRGGRLDVCVGEDDVGRLAAQLQRHPLDRVGGPAGDPGADLGRPREGDLGDVGVLDQALAADRARSRHDVEHALGQAGLERDALELDRRQRRELGGLEHDRVGRRQRRRHLPGGDHQREVPGRDHPDRRPSARGRSCRRRRRPGSSCRSAARPRPRSSGSTRRPCRSRRGRSRSACPRCEPPGSPGPRAAR